MLLPHSGCRAGPYAGPLGTAVLVAALFAGTATAQSIGASESGLVLSHGLIASGGDSLTTTDNEAYSTLGQAATGDVLTSANYQIHTGIAWMAPEVTSDTPILAGAREAAGPSAGGDTVTLFGFNFAAAGAGPLNADFGGNAGTSTTVLDNVSATTTTPLGRDTLGNPVTPVALSVNNFNGSHTADGGYYNGFFYLPAVIEDKPARVGKELRLRILGESGDFYFLSLGKDIPGFGIPIAPFDGALVLTLNTQILVSFQPVPDGGATFSATLPDSPGIVGGFFRFQSLNLKSVLGPGSFSNMLQVMVHP